MGSPSTREREPNRRSPVGSSQRRSRVTKLRRPRQRRQHDSGAENRPLEAPVPVFPGTASVGSHLRFGTFGGEFTRMSCKAGFDASSACACAKRPRVANALKRVDERVEKREKYLYRISNEKCDRER